MPLKPQTEQLFNAIGDGDFKAVQTALNAGAEFDVMDPYHMPIHLAAKGGHTEIVKLLIDKGNDVDAHDGYQWTPLHHAARDGHMETVNLLLKRGANPNALAAGRRTAHDLAVESNQVEIANLLKEKTNFKKLVKKQQPLAKNESSRFTSR